VTGAQKLARSGSSDSAVSRARHRGKEGKGRHRFVEGRRLQGLAAKFMEQPPEVIEKIRQLFVQ
jgi:hypothetical protein